MIIIMDAYTSPLILQWIVTYAAGIATKNIVKVVS